MALKYSVSRAIEFVRNYMAQEEVRYEYLTFEALRQQMTPYNLLRFTGYDTLRCESDPAHGTQRTPKDALFAAINQLSSWEGPRHIFMHDAAHLDRPTTLRLTREGLKAAAKNAIHALIVSPSDEGEVTTKNEPREVGVPTRMGKPGERTISLKPAKVGRPRAPIVPKASVLDIEGLQREVGVLSILFACGAVDAEHAMNREDILKLLGKQNIPADKIGKIDMRDGLDIDNPYYISSRRGIIAVIHGLEKKGLIVDSYIEDFFTRERQHQYSITESGLATLPALRAEWQTSKGKRAEGMHQSFGNW